MRIDYFELIKESVVWYQVFNPKTTMIFMKYFDFCEFLSVKHSFGWPREPSSENFGNLERFIELIFCPCCTSRWLTNFSQCELKQCLCLSSETRWQGHRKRWYMRVSHPVWPHGGRKFGLSPNLFFRDAGSQRHCLSDLIRLEITENFSASIDAIFNEFYAKFAK